MTGQATENLRRGPDRSRTLCLPIAGDCADPRVLVELARLAESAGSEDIFLEDYIVDPRDERTCESL